MNYQSKIRSFFSFVLSILEELVSIGIGLTLIIIEKRMPGSVKVYELLLAILSIAILLAVSNLRDRVFYLRKIKERVGLTQERLQQKVFDPIRASNFFLSESDIDCSELLDSRLTLISGISLVRTIGKLHEEIHDSVIGGAHVKILTIDENSDDSISQLIKRSWGKVPPDYYHRRIASTNEQIRVIAENIKGSSVSRGTLEIGRLPFVPSFGLIATNANSKLKGKVNVKIYHHLTDNKKPTFNLQSCEDPEWFDFFIEQFDMMWQISKKTKLI